MISRSTFISSTISSNVLPTVCSNSLLSSGSSKTKNDLILYLIIYAFILQAVPLVQLTLPGIAGIILSLGMAVDANVIVFERIKEEYASGKKIHMSVNSGFKNAFSAILDSNVTTIIASVVLYILGTSTIKGFAITLFIGIVVSMFTAIFVTRTIFMSFMYKRTIKHLSI